MSFPIFHNQGALSGGALDLAFQASATSTGASVTWPTVQAGDLAILADTAYQQNQNSPPNTVVPSGFTALSNTSGISGGSNQRRHILSYKVCDGSESGSLTGMDGNSGESKVLLIFRVTKALASASPSTWNEEFTFSNPSSQSVLASAGAAPLVVIGSIGCSTTGPTFSTASPAFDDTVGADIADASTLVGYKVYNADPSDHTIDMNDLGIQALTSGYIEVTA